MSHKRKTSEETFRSLESLQGGDPFRDKGKEDDDDIEMVGLRPHDTSNVNTVTDIAVQSEIIRLDQRIDLIERKVYSRGCCGAKRLAAIVFVIAVLLVVNFIFDFWHMILDTVHNFEN
jgi:hypothetical protein